MIVLRKNATVKVLDILRADHVRHLCVITLWLIVTHAYQLCDVFRRIFSEAFGLRQVAAGGFGAVLMNGVKRGLFSNEAGSGSAPCAAATAETPVIRPGVGLTQAFGVFIDTLLCTCTAMVMLLAPQELVDGLQGMDLLADGYVQLFWSDRCHLHRPDLVDVQFFHLHRHPVLCPVQCGLSVR